MVATLPANEIGLADAAATALLSLGTSLRGRDGKLSAWALLQLHDRREELSEYLGHIAHDIDVHDLDREAFDSHLGFNSAAHEAWALLDEMGVGVVARNKLLAGKRPRLIPVFDRQVAIALSGRPNPTDWWSSWWQAMTNPAVQSALSPLQGAAPDVSPLRVADVVVWMAVKGRSQSSDPGPDQD